MNKNRHIGSNFDGFLQEEGLLAEAEATAVKRARVWEGGVGVPGEDRGDGRVPHTASQARFVSSLRGVCATFHRVVSHGDVPQCVDKGE